MHVAVDAPVYTTLAYLTAKPLPVGTVVKVPLKNRHITGVVLAERYPAPAPNPRFLKPIDHALVPHGALSETLIQWGLRLARYYQHPIGTMLCHMAPSFLTKRKLDPPKPTPQIPRDPQDARDLTPEQDAALIQLRDHLDQFGVWLLEGVTGSGKTEVYAHVIAQALTQGRSAIVLVPEIALVDQMSHMLKQSLGIAPVVLHSRLKPTERRAQWWRAQHPQQCIVGARSALFAPIEDLGVIIVDEEHDENHYHASMPHFSARDAATMLGQQRDCMVLLGSATPSLESMRNVSLKRYQHQQMTSRVHNDVATRMQVITSKAYPNPVSSRCVELLKDRLTRLGGKALVIRNRRGFATCILCPACHTAASCTRCDFSLTWHRSGFARCHLCGHKPDSQMTCHACHQPLSHPDSHEPLMLLGSGTQRVEEQLQDAFEGSIPVIRIDGDQANIQQSLQSLNDADCAIGVGTRLLSHGHDFHDVHTVLAVGCDAAIASAEPRDLERFGQLIEQLAGRAGRRGGDALCVLQTTLPDHPAIQTLVTQRYAGMARWLLDSHKRMHLPPFQHVGLVRAEALSAERAEQFLVEVRQVAEKTKASGVVVYPVVPAAIRRIAQRHRFVLRLTGTDRVGLSSTLFALLRYGLDRRQSVVRWWLEVDPQDLY